MPDKPGEQSTSAERVPSLEAVATARDLAAQVRAIAESLPFGTDPAEFAAALERLAMEEEPQALP
jgi:hypothetical protein